MNGEVKKLLKRTIVLITFTTLLITAFSGCVEEEGKTIIKIEGSSTVYPIADRAANDFNDAHDDIEIQVAVAAGSGAGITALGEGRADIADASREVKQSEIDEYTDVDFYDNIVAYDGVAIIVSSAIYNDADNPVTNLTTEQVKQIATGEITNWNEVGGPNMSIAFHEREEGSGTRDTFMEALDIEETTAVAAWQSNSLLKSAVEEADNAIGYAGLGYVSTTTPSVELNGYQPNEETIKSGDYPISRSLHMYTDGAPTGALQTFIDYVQSDAGQDIVEDEGFIRID
jgi:phosphate transport system substrate-binding protein